MQVLPRRPFEETSAILQRLKWLTGLRLLLASALLGSAVVLDLRERLPFPTSPLYILLGLTFGLSLFYALGLRSQQHLLAQGLVQLALDLGLVSLLVHYTGGLDSAFAFMYIFVVFEAANLLERHGSLAVAILCGSLYAALVIAEWTHLIQPVDFTGSFASLRPAGYAVYQVLVHAVAFLAVAILSSHLADRLRRAGQELDQKGLDLRSLQTLHEAIVANISSGLLTLDLAGRVVSFNAAAEQITGYDFADLRDRHWQSTPFAACPTLAEFFAQPHSPQTGPAQELYVQRKDGRAIPVGIACSPLHTADGGPVGLVAIFQDLTERKRVQEQLRRTDRLAALGHLAANIAHEIRNPLAAISGSVEVLKEDQALAGPNRELLDIILREASRLKLITGQFLDFAKPQPMVFRPCRVQPLLEETLQLLAKSSQRHPRTSWVVSGEDPELHAFADADQLRQVVWNLCLNAMQAMPEGGSLTIAIRVASDGGQLVSPSNSPASGTESPAQEERSNVRTFERSAASRQGEWVEIAFQDTGRGIPTEELDRIFDPFYTTRPSGTGLGLAIARRILESMGGHIGVESRPGLGTTFRVWLRRAPVPVGAESRK